MASSSEDGACLRRKIAGREVPRRWAGDDSEDESARDQNRVRPQRANACLPSAALREAGAILLLDRAGRRRTARPSRPDPQVSWCGKHLFRRYLHIRGRMRGATIATYLVRACRKADSGRVGVITLTSFLWAGNRRLMPVPTEPNDNEI